MPRPPRVGLIVPSSNTTIETEVPEMLRRAGLDVAPTFHSSRAVLHTVDAESLARMVDQSDRCARELADAHVDVVAYACLVAVMAGGPGAHEGAEARMAATVAEARGGEPTPVTSSAGALVRALHGMGARRIAIITPYAPPLTAAVADYLEGTGLEVVDRVSLNVTDNVAVADLDPAGLLGHARGMDLTGVDVLVASACVQMPSLAAIPELEAELGLPVVTAATATAAEILDALGAPRSVPGAGALLADAPVATTAGS